VKALAINYLLDAGPLIALLDEGDQWHKWSCPVLEILDEPLYTTEGVVTEACHALRKLRPALRAVVAMITERRLRVIPVFPADSVRIDELLGKYPQMDLGDATLVVLSERYPRARLITIDRRDFTVYRRKDGNPVPSIMPPVS
jgi:predicted nucleic acid-binding protein